MEYKDYKKILDQGMIGYVNNGGSVLYMGNATKEYVFDYEDENISYEARIRLEDKAVKAIIGKKKLPDGIRLKQCVWHERKDNE
ncbi:hypothetical protein AALC75_22495 [Lachnospiraceae bacterium 48-42]